MIKLNNLELELADILLNSVLNKTGKFTYSELAEKLSSQLGRNVNPHYGLSVPLGNVSILCNDLELPLLSAWVIYSDKTGRSDKVSGGFYKFACDYRPEFKHMSPNEAWKSELKKIRNCTDWSRLRSYLDGEVPKTTPNRAYKTPSIEEIKQIEEFERKIQLQKFYQESEATEPVFPDEVDASSELVLREGSIKQVLINVHERNTGARRICIGRYGTKCAVCGVDLGDIYGPEFSGKLHVHHLKPIGGTDDEHEIDPIRDLRPVCPNCHMIIHSRQGEPYTIDEVKNMMRSTDASRTV